MRLAPRIWAGCVAAAVAAGFAATGSYSVAADPPRHDEAAAAGEGTRPSVPEDSAATTSSAMDKSMATVSGTPEEAAYVLSADAATMGNIVGMVRQRYRIPLCFEDVQYDPEHDIVTLKDVIARYEEIQKHRPLSVHEQELFSAARQLLEGGAKPELVFDVNSERYSKEFRASTVKELLTAITSETPYQWKERNGTYLIYPRAKSSVGFTVTIDVTDASLNDVIRAIVSQAPEGNQFNLNAAQTFRSSPVLEGAAVPRLKLSEEPAMNALCRAVEAADRRIVWSIGGYIGRRNIGLAVLPENGP